MPNHLCAQYGYWAADKATVQRRAADLRMWLYARPEPHVSTLIHTFYLIAQLPPHSPLTYTTISQVLLVTHGAFLHYLTEDWTGDDPKRGKSNISS
jgi:hypothetical protein